MGDFAAAPCVELRELQLITNIIRDLTLRLFGPLFARFPRPVVQMTPGILVGARGVGGPICSARKREDLRNPTGM